MATLITGNIPEEMKNLPQWVVWNFEQVEGRDKPTKVLKQINGHNADSMKPATWTTFENAVKAVSKFDGIGFVFTKESGIIGIDFDHIIEKGVWDPAAKEEVFSFNSYTELSPSGAGIHVYVHGDKIGDKCKKALLDGTEREMYSKGRFFTVTGNHVEETPLKINSAQDAIEKCYNKWFIETNKTTEKKILENKEPTAEKKETTIKKSPQMEDSEILKLCLTAANSAKFIKLFNKGDISDYENDESSADEALCTLLAFYTQDEEQIARLFIHSALVREKWGNRQDYRDRTIKQALSLLTEIYKKPAEVKLTKQEVLNILSKITLASDVDERIAQAAEFARVYLTKMEDTEANIFLITKLQSAFMLQNRKQLAIVEAVYKSTKKEEKEAQKVSSISFGETADFAGQAVATLADEFRENYMPTFYLGGAMYTYDDGVYKTDTTMEDKAAVFIHRLAEKHKLHITPKNAEQVLKRVKTETSISAEELNKDPERLVVKNGILDVKAKVLYPPNAAEKHIIKSNVTYDPEKQLSEDFKNYLDTTFKGVEWEIPIIQEMIGYCLYKAYPLEKFFFLIGDGGNGRSTLLNLIEKLLGKDNTSSLDLHDVCNPKDTSTLLGLHGRLANLCGETGTEDITNLGKMKKVTGRDTIRARDLYKSWIEFKSFSKIIVSMNQPPHIEDGTRGRKRRLVHITFPNKFIEGQNADGSLEAKLFTEDSLSGVLNWALEGLARIFQNGKLSDERSEAQMTLEYERKSTPIKYFVMDHVDTVCGSGDLLQDDNAFKLSMVRESEIIQAYTKYAQKKGLPSLTETGIMGKLYTECLNAGYRISKSRLQYQYCKDHKCPRENYFKGIELCGLDDLGIETPKSSMRKESTIPTVKKLTHNEKRAAGATGASCI